MTDINKKQTGKGGAKGKKLRLNKETLKDMRVRKAGPVGGRRGLEGNNQSGKPNC